MMTGHVNDLLEMVIPIAVRGPSGLVKTVDLIIDTGFSSVMILPPDIIHELQLNEYNRGFSRLADGSLRQHQNFAAEIFWNDQWRSIVVMGIGHEALLGTGLLAGHELQATLVESGIVKISAIV